jgi:Ca-activated chloride channel family protein
VLVKPNVPATGWVLLLATLVAPSALAVPTGRSSAGDAELGAGLWMVEGEGDEPWLAPQVSTEVHLHVDGMIAHARVEQLFDNPSEEAVEAVYVFPVADGAAVDGVSLQVGPRTLTADLRERAAAASAFESAADGGRVAALVERERRDVLTTRVANIPPGASVTVTLRYRQLVGAAHGGLMIDVPTTLIPRAGFGGAEGREGARAAGAGERVAARLAPPVALDGSGPLFDVWVELARDVEPGSVESTSHAIDVAPRDGGLSVRLTEGPVLADRDFVLRWQPSLGDASLATISEDIRGERYLLATLPAPLGPRTALGSTPESARMDGRRPRDITFVVDTSRSMAGAALTQASAALGAALARMTPLDHFNVIEAASPPRPLFEASRPASALAIAEALERAGALRAAGDTALAPALELALAARPAHPERSERVVLISDGDMGDERQLFRQVERWLGTRRLFTLGVGPAPGRYALRGAARAGRGTFTAISDLGEVSERVAELDAELGSPMLEGLAVLGSDARARLGPELYAGEPLLVLARLPTDALGVTVTGRSGAEPWQRQIALGGPARNTRLDRLWAWREIELIEATGKVSRHAAARRLQLALQGGLASAQTTFVAVDSARSVEQRAPRSAVPLALPAGSEIFGKLPEFPPPGPTCSREPPSRGPAEPRSARAPDPLPRRRPVAARAHVQCGLSG